MIKETQGMRYDHRNGMCFTETSDRYLLSLTETAYLLDVAWQLTKTFIEPISQSQDGRGADHVVARLGRRLQHLTN